jgi:hypothetical protein
MTTGPTSTQGLATAEEVFGRAAVETEWGGDDDSIFPPDETSAPDEAAKPADGEAPKDAASDATKDESIFGDLEDSVAPKVAPGGIDWEQQVEIPGAQQPVKLREMRDGYLRHADYTRKTQALADERRQMESENSNALRLYAAFAEDPVGAAAYLATKMGLVDEAAVAGKVKDLKGVWAPPPKPAEIEKIIEQQVEQRLAEHPKVREAEQATAVRAVEKSFTDLETKHQVKLSDRDRAAILRRAIQAGTTDLDLTFTAMMAEVQRVRKGRDDVKQSATNRPGPRDTTAASKPAEIKSVADAFGKALEDLAGART